MLGKVLIIRWSLEDKTVSEQRFLRSGRENQHEKEHYPVSLPDLIRELMERKALKDKDLIPAIGSKTTVSLELNRKRELTVHMIRKLSTLLSLPVEVLIQPYKLDGRQQQLNTKS